MTTFDFAEFLVVAEALRARGDQASFRSAISRAYYAALGVAYRTIPTPQRSNIDQRNVHRATWALYTASSDRRMRHVGNRGIRLRTWRNIADYDGGQTVSDGDAAARIADARAAVGIFARLGFIP